MGNGHEWAHTHSLADRQNYTVGRCFRLKRIYTQKQTGGGGGGGSGGKGWRMLDLELVFHLFIFFLASFLPCFSSSYSSFLPLLLYLCCQFYVLALDGPDF